MGDVQSVIEEVWDWIVNKIDRGFCHLFSYISNDVCKFVDDKPVWFDGHGWEDLKVLFGLIIFVATVAGVVFAWDYIGQAIYLARQDLGILYELMTAPFNFVTESIKWIWGHFYNINSFLAEKTSTFIELWWFIDYSVFFFGLIETAKSIAEWGFEKPLDSFFWKVYFFIETPIKWINDLWLSFFTSWWNPLRFLSPIFFYTLKSYCFLLAAVINALNPLRWFQAANAVLS